MKSVKNSNMDFRTVPIPSKLINLSYPVDEINRAIMRRCEKAASFEVSTGPAREGDIVILTYSKDGYMKKVHVNISRGADRRLEDFCIGRYAGESFSFTYGFSKETTDFFVANIVRKSIPMLSNDLMKVIEPDREISAEDYRKEIIEQILSAYIHKSAAAYFNIIVNKAVKEADFVIDPGELNRLMAEYHQMFSDYANDRQMSLEDTIKNAMPEGYEKSQSEYLREIALKELKKAVSCNCFCGNDSSKVPEDQKVSELVEHMQDSLYEMIYDYLKEKINWLEDKT